MQQLLRGSSPAGCGADTPEGQMEALYQIATGDGQTNAGANVPANHKGIGGAEFRDGALPVVVTISDASFHDVGDMPPRTCYGSPVSYSGEVAKYGHPSANGGCAEQDLRQGCRHFGDAIERRKLHRDQRHDLLRQRDWRGGSARGVGRSDASKRLRCGQVLHGLRGAGEEPDANGLCPLVFKVQSDGTGVGDQVTAGIAQLAQFASFDVVTDVVGQKQGEKGEIIPDPKTTADFIKSITPLDALPPPPPPFIPAPVMTEKGFTKVVPGSFVRFNVTAHNDRQRDVPSAGVPRNDSCSCGGCANLDSRDVIILVPPVALTPG